MNEIVSIITTVFWLTLLFLAMLHENKFFSYSENDTTDHGLKTQLSHNPLSVDSMNLLKQLY